MTVKKREIDIDDLQRINRTKGEPVSFKENADDVQFVDDSLKDVPVNLLTEELCKKAVIQSAKELNNVPFAFMTPSFVVEVARQSTYDCVRFVPEAFRKSAFYYELVCLDPEFIWYIPRKALTAKIGKAVIKGMGYSTTAEAVKAKPALLSRLHCSLYDHETCLSFVMSDYFKNSCGEDQDGNPMIGFNTEEDRKAGRIYLGEKYTETYSLPHMMKWPDVAIMLLAINGVYISFVDQAVLTEEMCLAAIESNPYAFRYLPPRFQTEKVCVHAFENDPDLIRWFPEEYITEQVALKAVENSGYNLEYLPDKYKTKKICLIAVSDASYSIIKYVPFSVLDKEIVLAYLRNASSGPSILQMIPKTVWDYDVCLAAVEKAGRDLQFVPQEFIDEKMCLHAVQNCSGACEFVPERLFSEELAMAAVSHDQYSFTKIPRRCITEDVCLQALKCGDRSAGSILQDIPKDMITQEMCDLAVRKTPRSIKYVPERFVSEDMLLYVTRQSYILLKCNFPERLRTKEFIQKLMNEVPVSKNYLSELIPEE